MSMDLSKKNSGILPIGIRHGVFPKRMRLFMYYKQRDKSKLFQHQSYTVTKNIDSEYDSIIIYEVI